MDVAGAPSIGTGGAPASSRDASKDADGSAPPAIPDGGDAAVATGGALIPEVTGECPTWQTGVVTFMGLDGIRLEVGARSQKSLVPLLFFWHSSAATSDQYTTMAAAVATGITQAGGVIVSFQGTTGGDLYSGLNAFGEGDLSLVDQLVACAVRDRGVDPRRIYTMGCSTGGFFATAMAGLRAQYVAAAVANSGGEIIDIPFASAHTPSLMTIHPSPGSTQFDFANSSARADKAFAARGAFVVDCQAPGGLCDYSLNDYAWPFFEAHPFGVSPEPWAIALPDGFPEQCKIQ